jgi:hypothetical protein
MHFLFLTCLQIHDCAWRDRVVYQRMNANGFIARWFILLKQSKTDGKIFEYGVMKHYYYLHTKWYYSQWLHTLCTMGPSCHAGLFFQSSRSLLEYCPCLSSAADQLLILIPAWRTGPSPIPPSRVDPISLRVQAPACFFVGYNDSLPIYPPPACPPMYILFDWLAQQVCRFSTCLHTAIC